MQNKRKTHLVDQSIQGALVLCLTIPAAEPRSRGVNRGDCPPRRLPFQRQPRLGAAAVEFAIIAPLFFLLLAGIIEFGQAFRIEHSLSNACRRGARAAVLEDSTNTQVTQLVRTYMANTLGVNQADVTVTITVNGSSNGSLSEAEQGDEIGVTASLFFSKAGAGFYANMLSNSNLSSTCMLEHE